MLKGIAFISQLLSPSGSKLRIADAMDGGLNQEATERKLNTDPFKLVSDKLFANRAASGNVARADYGQLPWDYDGTQVEVSGNFCGAAMLTHHLILQGGVDPNDLSARLARGETVPFGKGLELTLTDEDFQRLEQLEAEGAFTNPTDRAEATIQMAVQNELVARTKRNQGLEDGNFVSRKAIHSVASALDIGVRVTRKWESTNVGDFVAYGMGQEKHVAQIIAESQGIYTLQDAYGNTWDVSKAELKQLTRGAKRGDMGHSSAVRKTRNAQSS